MCHKNVVFFIYFIAVAFGGILWLKSESETKTTHAQNRKETTEISWTYNEEKRAWII